MKVPRRVPWGLVGMIGLVVAAERFVARNDADFTGHAAWDWRLSRRAAGAVAPGCEVLCFGDSLVKYGVQPRVLQARLGRRAHSLALMGGAAPASYFLLRRALDRGARPAAVVVDFDMAFLAKDPLKQGPLNLWAELAGVAEMAELARAGRDASAFAAMLLDRLLPSARGRYEVRAAIVAALRGRADPNAATVPILWRNWNHNQGAQLNPREARVAEVVPPPDLTPSAFGWRCHPVNARYVRAFFGLAAARGIPVFWLLPPLQPGLQVTFDRGGYRAHHDRFIRAIRAEYPGVVVLDARHAGFTADLFTDPAHLDRQGAFELSVAVAAVVGRHLAGASGPRWVDLPARHGLAPDPQLEDMGQSSMALEALGALRR
jgi:hypothetical protein